jgi:hypothetical protein
MATVETFGPGTHIRLGNSDPWRPNLVRLKRMWDAGKVVLCLGAGVSIPYGLPNWNDLVLALLLRMTPQEGGRRGPEHRWHRYFPHYRRALGSWMIEHFRFDPVKLARVFEQDKGLLEKIREELYAPLNAPADGKRRTSLDAVVDMIKSAEAQGSPVRAVITLNYDDLLETKLREVGVTCTAVYGPRMKVTGLPVYHVHGYLPRDGRIPKQDLVFTEGMYHNISSSGFHWSVKTITRYLHTHSVLFVGVSLIDPNLRRFLDACQTDGDDARHFAIREDYEVPDGSLDEAMTAVEKKARHFARDLGDAAKKPPEELRRSIRNVCEVAHNYDRDALRSLGVRAIWVKDRNDIPTVLDSIRTAIPSA